MTTYDWHIACERGSNVMGAYQENDQRLPGVAEPSQLPPRVVYGYVRVVRGATERAAMLKGDLLEFCRNYGYMLGTVFIDWGLDDTSIARPGFSSLLDVCQLVGSNGVVVPAKTHLSTHEETLAVLTHQIQRTGVKLIAADEVTAHRYPLNAATPEDQDNAGTGGGAS
ncbi:recombinase family protein [Kibdelosporangium lantanae]|uniref:Recombinase family protein n=1 Tax=Kibdelosporangium lantanae TaxID=1497396 RepID=A0ABW3M0J6_9PSEU